MPRKRLLWQLYPSFLAVTAIALGLLAWHGTHSIRSFYHDQTSRDLAARARLAAPTFTELLRSGQFDALRQQTKNLGLHGQTRLTVIATDGRILADSMADPARMDNHADRPEVTAAMAGELRSSIRYSYTLHQPMMYLAIPLTVGRETIGILRTSVPTTVLDNELHSLYRKIAGGGLFCLVLLGLISWHVARQLNLPLAAMRQSVNRLAAGDFSHKLPAQKGSAEINALAEALNTMTARLAQQIGALAEQHRELETVFASMVEGVLAVDTEERIRNMNRACRELLGLDPEKIKGRNMLEAIRNSELQRFTKSTLAGSAAQDSEIVLPDNNGANRFFLLRGVPLKDAQGHTIGALIVMSNVTNLRRLETVRRDFVANVSHELKTPITSIEGFVETLLDGALDDGENARRFLEIIHKQSKRLHAIVEDLLALSRLEQEAEEIPLALHDLAPPIEAALQTCTAQKDAKLITIELHCPTGCQALINPPLFEQAMVNLIDNAIKYSPIGRRIVITATSGETEVVVSVQDHGVGIAAKDQPRLFERFYRVDKARSTTMGGTGLGLSIVKHIVQAHHGRITLQSALGKGSTFSIQLRKGPATLR